MGDSFRLEPLQQATYEGQTNADGKRHGVGLCIYPEGTVYEGEWANDKQHGHGLCAFPSGNVYVGQWKDGVIEGRGIMLYQDSDIFEGMWVRGVCDGEGTFYSGTSVTCGVWRGGERVSTRTTAKQKVIPERLRGAILSLAHALRCQCQLHSMRALTQGTAAAVNTSPSDKPLASTSGPKPQPRKDSVGRNLGDAASVLTESKSPQLPKTPRPHAIAVDVPAQSPQLVVNSSFDAPPPLTPRAQPLQQMPKASQNDIMFVCCGPGYNSCFDAVKFVRSFVAFIFPFFSLPHTPCPCRFSALEEEREYVVSGAALRIDFEQPYASIYLAAIAFVAVALAWVFSQISTDIGAYTTIASVDIILPLLAYLLFALMNATYHSYVRIAHPLERIDRHGFPKMAAFVGSCVDSQADVCIYTWDEEGNSRVTNSHYHYRWLVVSMIVGLLASAISPIYRAFHGVQLFGDDKYERTGAVFAAIGILLTFTGVTYFILKITDMERQVHSQLAVISRLAYLNGQSLLRPTDHRKVRFELDSPVSTQDLKSGFCGWFVTRCFVLYASTVSNHVARHSSISAVFLFMFVVQMVVFVDVIYALSREYIQRSSAYFTSAHLMGLWLVLSWGSLLIRYVYVCLLTERERQRHLYIFDVAALYHHTVLSNANSCSIIETCRSMTLLHDQRTTVFNVRLSPFLFVVWCGLHILSCGVLVYQLVNYIIYS